MYMLATNINDTHNTLFVVNSLSLKSHRQKKWHHLVYGKMQLYPGRT